MMEIFVALLLAFFAMALAVILGFGIYLFAYLLDILEDRKRKNNIKKYRGSYYYDPDEDK